MSVPMLWWLAAAILVAAELATGTFYLLMLGLGLAAGALAAHAGLDTTGQMLCAALTGGGAVAIWHLHRQRRPPTAPQSENPELNLDIGQQVHVTRWLADGSARVSYRGSTWTARLHQPASNEAAPTGNYRIRAVDGNTLLLER